jgi:hypothetical protein
MIHNPIPDDWSAEQAFAVYELLAELQQLIWDRYELQLYALLRPDVEEEVDDEQLALFEFNDEIPF